MIDSSLNIAIIGGSGFWTETNHAPNLLELLETTSLPIKVKAIVDPINPESVSRYENIQKLLDSQHSVWISPTDMSMEKLMDQLCDEGINLLIVASYPVNHFEYILNGLERGMHVICDKPVLNEANSSTSVYSAKQIYIKYLRLVKAYEIAKQRNPNLLCSLILRRRTLPIFLEVADTIRLAATRTGAGINNANFLIHGGIYKHPHELSCTGAHGYTDGVGSLSHSAYHYLDLMNWYLSIAPGKAVGYEIRLANIMRVSDYINTKMYESFFSNAATPIAYPAEVLGAELDVAFYIDLLDKYKNKCGSIHFANNHISFSNRTRPVRLNDHEEPANYIDGGRVSHVTVDIHQGGMQNIQILKNDVVFENNAISLKIRRNPKLDGEAYQESHFENAYGQKNATMRAALEVFIRAIVENKRPTSEDINDLLDEQANMKMFSEMYTLIADDYAQKKSYKKPVHTSKEKKI